MHMISLLTVVSLDLPCTRAGGGGGGGGRSWLVCEDCWVNIVPSKPGKISCAIPE